MNDSGQEKTAILIIDMISDFEFEDAEELYKHVLPAAECIAELKRKAAKAQIPVIYINDNFGQWHDDFRKIIDSSQKSARGQKIIKLLEPFGDDYFVLKPKHSAFFSTTLDLLLEDLKVKTLILIGVSTDICILFTANDAYMRDYNIVVPHDCVASVDPADSERALKYMKRVLKAEILSSNELEF